MGRLAPPHSSSHASNETASATEYARIVSEVGELVNRLSLNRGMGCARSGTKYEKR